MADKAQTRISRDLTISYRVYLPDDYGVVSDKAWPLVVFLHGAGERGDDLDLLDLHGPTKEAAEGREFPFILLAPQCPKDSVWPMQTDRVLEAIDIVRRQYRVDSGRIYLTGLSMGGFGTWEIAMEYPQMFAAILPMCGGGMSWRAGNLQRMPIWTFHGAKDDVVPIRYTEEMVRALKALEIPVQFTIYPDAGHDCWTEAYRREDIYDWLLRQENRQSDGNGPKGNRRDF